LLLDLIVFVGSASDNEKVELRSQQFAQTRDSEKLIFDFDLGTETALSHRVRTQSAQEIYATEIWPIGFAKVELR
jgi:hypothetical protein